QNPLIGPNNDELGTRFPDLSEAYNRALGNIAKDVAKEHDITLHEGVYTWWTGSAYETLAVIRMIRTFGGDAVGLSNVQVASISAHDNINVLGISCLTNMACGILDEPLRHEDVIAIAAKSREAFMTLIKNVMKKI